jgi:hypothetical protein
MLAKISAYPRSDATFAALLADAPPRKILRFRLGLITALSACSIASLITRTPRGSELFTPNFRRHITVFIRHTKPHIHVDHLA